LSLERIAEIAAALERHRQTHKLEHYSPYPFQKRFHNAMGHKTDRAARVKALIAGNQTGKSHCAASEMAMHLTGLYPDWYTGQRFVGPVKAICAGVTNELTRDICQQLLFGDPTDPKTIGTGTVPIDCVGRQTRKAGVPDALETVRVKHKSGRWSVVQFKCYEQGPEKFMGIQAEVAWLDEEPPPAIFSQIQRAGFAKTAAIILLTFTPEKGMTEVVNTLFDRLPMGYAMVQATWDDSPHMTPELQAEKMAGIRPHEREMRMKGVPFAGAGLIFPVTDESIIVDPFEIPTHWPQIIGIDFGWDHPFAAARLAFNRDSDCVYVASEYHETHATPPIHAAAIKPWGAWIPVAWPADGLQTEKGAGTPLSLQYRTQGLALLPEHFTNPPNFAEGKAEGSGGIAVEPGLMEMLTRMQTGRFKVFRTCQKFLQEKRTYHRDEHGRVVKQFDDVASAARYATMSLRHARTKPIKRDYSREVAVGARNW